MENGVKNKKALVAMVVAVLAVVIIGVTVAYFTSSHTVESEYATASYKTTETKEWSNPVNWTPGTTTDATLSLKNEGSIAVAVRAQVIESWESGKSTKLSSGEPSVLKNMNGDWIYSGGYYYYNAILNSGESTTTVINSVTFNPSADTTYASDKYKLSIKLETIQADAYKTAWGIDLSNLKVLYNVIANNSLATDKDINIGTMSSDTNGKGIYQLSKVSTSAPIYYYRGAVQNNNVIFANKCWLMIRTTDTKGVKLIYNGEPTDGVCPKQGDTNYSTNSRIGTSAFHGTTNNDPEFVKYKGTWAENSGDSAIKKYIEDWYVANLTDFTSALEDTPFYSETSSTDYPTGECIRKAFAAGARIWGFTDGKCDATTYGNSVPNTTVILGNGVSKDDTYTVGSTGNGKLEHPIGLLTSDEAVLAGGRGYISGSDTGANSSYYLYTGAWYWTLSPFVFGTGGVANVIGVGSGGWLYADNVGSTTGGVRPVVSLQPGTTYSSGNGTATTPYIVVPKA